MRIKFGEPTTEGAFGFSDSFFYPACPLRSTALASRSSRRRCTGSRFDELRLNRYVHIIADRRVPGRQAKIGAIEMPVGGKSERFLLCERVRRVAVELDRERDGVCRVAD